MPTPVKNSVYKTGFTLIELLVVVSIITVLVGVILVVVNPAQIQAKSRDARRIQNLQTIQSAIELFRIDKGYYPQRENWQLLNGTDQLSRALITGGYLRSFPEDPKPSNSGSSPCSPVNNQNFYYKGRTDLVASPVPAGVSYFILAANMEVASSVGKNQCSSLPSWGLYGCSNPTDFCFGIEGKGL